MVLILPLLPAGSAHSDEFLPWDVLDHGIDKGALWQRYQKALIVLQTVEKSPSAALLLAHSVTAAYERVRLIPHDFSSALHPIF